MAKEKLRLDSKTGEFVPVLDNHGSEVPDPVPMAPPIGFVREPPLHERIRAMVLHEHQRLKDAQEYETEEEANDFRLEEDELDGREGRFAMQPGFEDDWEDNYEPPRDFKEMRERLVAAGWTPPADQPRTPPEGGAAGSVELGGSAAPAREASPSGDAVPRPGSKS